jgi:hypothetical protein
MPKARPILRALDTDENFRRQVLSHLVDRYRREVLGELDATVPIMQARARAARKAAGEPEPKSSPLLKRVVADAMKKYKEVAKESRRLQDEAKPRKKAPRNRLTAST